MKKASSASILGWRFDAFGGDRCACERKLCIVTRRGVGTPQGRLTVVGRR